MTRERALQVFRDFFRFGDAMDPDAPETSKGLKRAAGDLCRLRALKSFLRLLLNLKNIR